MDAAKAAQASGAALVVKSKADYAEAKKDKESALQELIDRLR